jgi:pimeloyl-ACP methyl ester carboxylesterase
MTQPAFLDLPDGRRIAYRFTPGVGPALVFLPGYMSDMAGGKAGAVFDWACAEGRACLLLDYSGCGESPGDFAQGTLSRWRDEVLALIAAQELDRVMLIGSSMGGWLMLLAALARPDGPWVAIDGYHAFMATPIDLAPFADRLFYLAGGYKYAMAGEGAAFIHAPPQFAPRPQFTGWYAAFDDLAAQQGGVGYAPDGRRFLGSTFDPSGLYRFIAVGRMLSAEGLTTDAISRHCDNLKARLLDAAALPAMRLISAPQARFLAFEGERAQALQAMLHQRQVITDVRGNVLRIGFGLYQDVADVDRLIAVLREIG